MSQKKKQVRENFRNEVFLRDGNKCRKCDKKECGLDAHHITDRIEMPNGGYVKENGISLCAECHIKAEVWHISGNLEFEQGYHPNDFYTLINSNYALALLKSIKLGS
jgi:5-methylcytosine-specific restriction endonuclease McrA